MKKLISARGAGNILLVALGLVMVFDVLVIVGVLPSDIVWGGQLGDSAATRVILESVALVVALLFAVVIAAKVGYLQAGAFGRVVTVGVWVICGFFILNTLGNLASGASFEKLIFAPVTVVLAILAWRVAVG